MSHLNPQKLHVDYMEGALPDGPIFRRVYTLTHSDSTGDLYLTIGLVYKKRAIPLVWMVYKGKKGHSSAEKQLALLEQVCRLLPEGAKVLLTGDAEFDGTVVVNWLESQPNWDYACRTAKNIQVRLSPSGDWQALAELAPPAGESRLLANLYFTRQDVGPVNIAIIWNEQDQEHLYLVTSADTLQEAQTWYRRRFKIETLFADAKSRGFGLDKSGIRHPKRMARFVIAVFLAYIWTIYLGVLVIQDHQLGLVARTDRCMHSLFQLGAFILTTLSMGFYRRSAMDKNGRFIDTEP